MGGIFVVVVVFYSVLGIRHHVLGIFLAENDLREIIMSFLPLVFILKCISKKTTNKNFEATGSKI